LAGTASWITLGAGKINMLTAGATVPGGYYLDRDDLDLVVVNGKQGELPGEEGTRFIRVPMWIALLVGTTLGALCLVAIPLLALARTLPHVVRLGRGGAAYAGWFSRLAIRLARWRPKRSTPAPSAQDATPRPPDDPSR
jgi:hypothetical protein